MIGRRFAGFGRLTALAAATAAITLLAVAEGRAAGTALPMVTTNAALKALPAGQYSTVYRAGFYANGDGGAAVYKWQGAACSIPDNGAQVAPQSGTGCWVAVLTRVGVDVRMWGAKCDGSTDDTVAFNAALNASKQVQLPGATCVVSSINMSHQNELRGQGRGQTNLWSNSATADMITVSSAWARITEMELGSLVTRTAGCFVTIPAVAGFQADHLWVGGAFRGFCINGASILTLSATYFDSTRPGGDSIYVNGGYALTIGPDITMNGPAAPASQPHAGIYVVQAGDLSIINADIIQQGDCLLVAPTAGLEVDSVKVVASFFDTCGQHGALFAPGGGVIQRVDMGQSWFATAQKEGIRIDTTAGGASAVNGVELGMAQIWNNSVAAGGNYDQFAAIGSNITRISINNSMVAGPGSPSTGAGVHMGGAVDWRIVGTTIGSYGSFSPPNTCLLIDSGGTNFLVRGNEIRSCPTALITNNSGPGTLATIGGNLGLDDQQPAVTSANSVTLANTPVQYMGGTTNVATMLGGWQGRVVTIIPTGVFSFVTGGNIAVGLGPTTVNVPVTATYSGGSWFLK